jgi:small-conductance mechanosensitive channel
MNKKLSFLSLFFLVYAGSITASLGPLTGLLKLDLIEEKNNFSALLEKQLALLQDDKNRIEETQAKIKSKLESTNNEITTVKDKLKTATGSERDFLNQKLPLVNQRYQVITEIEQALQQIITLIDTHSKVLQEYKQDPEFKNKNLRLPIKSLYLFSDMQKINDLIGVYENELKELEDKAKKVAIDLENRQKSQLLVRQEYSEKKKQQEEFSGKSEGFARYHLTPAQRGDLLDEEEQLFKYKKDLADLRVKEVELRRNFLLDTQIKITKLQLQILRDEYEKIKKLFQVDEKYLRQSEAELEQARQDSALKQRKYKDAIEGLELAKINLQEDLNTHKSQFNLSLNDIQAITDWLYQPTTLTAWKALFAVHKIVQNLALMNINKEQFEAEIEKERAKQHQQEIITKVINTWYHLTSPKGELHNQEALNKEIKYYETIRADVQAADTLIAERRVAANNQLSSNSKLLENLKNRLKELKNQKESLFKNHPTEYTHYFSRLKDAEEDLRVRGEPLARIIELYGQIHEIQQSTLQKVDSILSELRSRALGKSTSRTLLKGLREFVPDIARFSSDMQAAWHSYRTQFTWPAISTLTTYYYAHFYELLSLILQIIILILLYLLIRLYLPDFIDYLGQHVGPEYGIGYTFTYFVRTVLRFINDYLKGLFIWGALFLAVYYEVIQEPILRILFYVFSIPYLLFYASRFIWYIATTNELSGHKLINKIYERRFFTVITVLLYTTIIILLLREAFIIGNYPKSQVPTMLLAINFIILQISILFLMGREQILSIIPRIYPLGELFYNYINRFYYAFLGCAIFVILMSNPYVGYGPQFFDIISRLILILLLIPLFSLIHNYVKRVVYFVFFQSGTDVIKERFPGAKTAYGIFVIFAFLFWVLIAFVIAANIWGYSIGLSRISEWLHKELWSAGIDETTGRTIIVMPISFIKVFGFFISGFVIAYIINKFVLRRVFDLLLVNIGVQNALLSLTRYFIIIAATVIGLLSVGLGSSLLYIFAIIGGLGVAAKEIIADFIGYFIILVQRPIKIGDFIMIDEDTRGVIRHITLRSVILRKKNSVTVIVPNSQIMNKPVVNWNYSRTFFAFDDILLTVPYTCDPSIVKEIILKVLESNSNILKNPAPVVQLRDFVDNGYQFVIRGFMSSEKVLEQNEIASDVRLELVKRLRNQNIGIACPTRTIKVISPESSAV